MIKAYKGIIWLLFQAGINWKCCPESLTWHLKFLKLEKRQILDQGATVGDRIRSGIKKTWLEKGIGIPSLGRTIESCILKRKTA